MENSGCSVEEVMRSSDESSSPARLSILAPPPPSGGLQRRGSGDSVLEVVTEAESRKLPSSQFKGVVPQPNGRWGAQIYEKHQRVWLGTFNEEEEAARAYDAAVQRFRGGDAVTNFKPLSESDRSNNAELLFLNTHSKSEIVDMLRKHTYHDELQQSRRLYGSSIDRFCYGKLTGGFRYQMLSAMARETLFDKPVTPSDVGKLNRLVIPKQHAEKHFPLQTGGNGLAARKGVLLNFEDAGGKVWRFRYSYWNSSQSYVMTKGWSRFVKEKCLKAGDVVSFLRSTRPEKQLFIDWKPRVVSTGAGGVALVDNPFLPVQPVRSVQVVRLFGVDIINGDGNNSDDGWNGKRRREMDLLPTVDQQISTKKC